MSMTKEVHTVLPSGEVYVVCQESQKVTGTTPFLAETGAWYNETGTTCGFCPVALTGKQSASC